jgi:hypothetical protein
MGTKNKIDDLRNHLFAALEALRDDEKPMEIERAKAIADVARVIVDSAKVEVAFIEATGNEGSGFIKAEPTRIDVAKDARRELAAVAGGR